jgi:hypothetical protein
MYLDEVVIAGLTIVALTCLFFVSLFIVIKRDIAKNESGDTHSHNEVKHQH